MRVLVDVDGVCADVHQAWLDLYNADYDDDLTVAEIDRWAIEEIVKPECGVKIFNYLANPELYTATPPIPGAFEGVQQLRGLGYEIVFVTAGFFMTKIHWLMKHGFSLATKPNFAPDVVMCQNKQLVEGPILIDDYAPHLAGRAMPILYDRLWNRGYEVTLRAMTWEEVIYMVQFGHAS